VTGIVTLPAGGLSGFFMQDPVGDGDPTTSDGILIFTGSAANLPDPGSIVQVTGKVADVTRAGQTGGFTEIDATAGSIQINGASPLPDPVALDPGLAQSAAYLQALEGMLVSYPASTVVTPTDDAGAYFALRNDRLPLSTRITVDQLGTGQPLLIDTSGGAFPMNLNELDTVPDLSGVLHFDNGAFRLEPLSTYAGQSTGIAMQPAPDDQPYLNIATLDCQNLSASLPPADLQTKIAKLSLAIQNELGSPDLIVAMGVGDTATINKLAQSAGNYLGLVLKGCNPAGTSTGLIFNIDRIIPIRTRLIDLEAPGFHKPACTLPNGETFTNPLFENPLVQVDVAVDQAIGLTMILNDWRSTVPDAAGQARLGVAALQSMLTQVDNDYVMLLGDLNQPENSDAMNAIEQNLQFVNLTKLAAFGSRYSVTQNGVSQALDHIFVNSTLASLVQSSGFAHYNADFSALPNRTDATTPKRAADHDGAFVHFQFLP
jgi:hypothetical protein